MSIITGLVLSGLIFGATPQVMWQQVFDRGGIEKANTIGLTSSAEIYASGESNEQGDKDVWTLKLDKAGDIIWERWFDANSEEAGNDLGVAPDASLVVACLQDIEATPKAFVISYDSLGDSLWHTNFFATQTNQPPVITSVSSDSHYVSVCGAFSNGQATVITALLDGEGKQKESESFNAYTSSCPTGITTSHNGYVLRSAGLGSCRLLWNELDLSNFQADIYDEGEGERGLCLAVNNGNYVFLGGELIQDSKRCMMLQKWESRGNILWHPAKRYDLGADEHCRDIKLDAISDCYLTGWQERGEEEDVALVKTDSAGNMLWAWIDTLEGKQQIEGIEVDEEGYIYLAGSHHNGENWDMLVMKVRQPLTISGRVTDSAGTPMDSITVSLTGDTTVEVVSDTDGFYEIEVYNGGSYTVEPDKPGWVFTPSSRIYNPLAHREFNQDFADGYYAGVTEPSHPLTFNLQVADNRILYSVPYATHVKIAVYDVQGRLVNRIIDGRATRGIHELIWRGKDDAGRSISSGIYFIRMNAGEFEEQKKIVVLR